MTADNNSLEAMRPPRGGPSLPKPTNPTEEALARIEARLDRLETTLGRLTDLLDQAPAMIGAITDIADDHIRTASADDIDIDARARQVLRIATQITAPQTLTALEKLAGRGEDLQRVLELVDALPGTVAMAVDIFDEFVAKAAEKGIDLLEVGHMMAVASTEFARFIQGPEFAALLDSGILDPEAVRVVGHAAQALTTICMECDEQKAGVFALMSAMREDDVRRALGFAVAFARQFGRRIGPGHKLLGQE